MAEAVRKHCKSTVFTIDTSTDQIRRLNNATEAQNQEKIRALSAKKAAIT